MRGVVRELPLLVCLAVLTALLTAIAAAAPALLDRLAGQAFAARLEQAQERVPGVTYTSNFEVWTRPGDDPGRDFANDLAAAAENLERSVSEELRGALGADSARVVLPGVGLGNEGPSRLSLLYATDAPRKAGYVAGRAPRERAGTVEIAVSTRTRDALELKLGQRLDLGPGGLRDIDASAVVVGVFTAKGDARIWREEPLLGGPQPRQGGGHDAMAVAAPGAILELQAQARVRLTAQWDVRLHLSDDRAREYAGAKGRAKLESALTATTERSIDEFCPMGTFGGLACELGRQPATTMDAATTLPDAMDEFGRHWAQGQAVVAFGLATLAVVALSAALVTALLAVRRRTDVLRLQRARGASALGLAAGRAGQGAPGALLGLAAGLAAARLVGEGTAVTWGLLAGLGCWLLLPLATFLAVRDRALLRGTAPGRKGRRAVAEAALLLLAGAGVWALRSRGTKAEAGPDPLLAAVPALLGLATVVVLVRCYPLPVRLLARWTARRRGAVALIALLRAAKEAPARALALLVLVVTLGGAVFGGLVAGTLTDGRAEGARWRAGADAAFLGADTYPQAAKQLADARGVRKTARVAEARITPRSANGNGYGATRLIGVDSGALREADPGSAAAAATAALPPADGAVPVLARGGPRVGELLDVEAAGKQLKLRVTATLPAAAADDRALGPLDRPEAPDIELLADLGALRELPPAAYDRSVLLLYGDALDTAALRSLVPRAAPDAATGELRILDEELARVADDELVSGLTRAHTVTTAPAVALALLALVLELLLSAPARGRTAARLRTMGLDSRQTAALHLLQLLPMVVAAVAGGTALGLALPALLGPALDLSTFTGAPGAPATHADPLLTTLLAAGCAALVLGAVALETWAGRRRGLGAVLRVGRSDE
ncbi:hypothetical protein ACIBI4_24745 [Streptomyces sp. NPDC050418]|uniref:hypothetical protein n=1 Tax=Streptomyces sp. NPDC050418 TaxID=3365612 RepID=UPI0037A23DDB